MRNPKYFVTGLPYLDRVEIVVDEDNASRLAAFLSGKYELGWDVPGGDQPHDWVQIKDTVKPRRRTCAPPSFRPTSWLTSRCGPTEAVQRRPRAAGDLLAIDRQAIVDAVFEGVGVSTRRFLLH